MNLTKRQKEILDFIRTYRSEHGISPTQREIRENFGLSSFGTVQKHLKRLEEKGALSREWNRSRGISPAAERPSSRGSGACSDRWPPAGRSSPFPTRRRSRFRRRFSARESTSSCACAETRWSRTGSGTATTSSWLAAPTAQNGQTVVALVRGEATLKRYYSEGSRVRLQPANAAMKPLTGRRPRRHGAGRRDGPDPRLRQRLSEPGRSGHDRAAVESRARMATYPSG